MLCPYNKCFFCKNYKDTKKCKKSYKKIYKKLHFSKLQKNIKKVTRKKVTRKYKKSYKKIINPILSLISFLPLEFKKAKSKHDVRALDLSIGKLINLSKGPFRHEEKDAEKDAEKPEIFLHQVKIFREI